MHWRLQKGIYIKLFDLYNWWRPPQLCITSLGGGHRLGYGWYNVDNLPKAVIRDLTHDGMKNLNIIKADALYIS